MIYHCIFQVFQGGVLLGSSIILFAISNDLRKSLRRVKEKTAALLGSLGVLIYAGTAFICMLLGANFLDYHAFAPFYIEIANFFGIIIKPDDAYMLAMTRSYGVLVVEIGVAFAVMAVMIWLYYNLSSAGKHDEGL